MKINKKRVELELARMCKNPSWFRTVGLSPQTVTRIMRGKETTPATVGKIAKVLGVDPADIIETEE